MQKRSKLPHIHFLSVLNQNDEQRKIVQCDSLQCKVREWMLVCKDLLICTCIKYMQGKWCRRPCYKPNSRPRLGFLGTLITTFTIILHICHKVNYKNKAMWCSNTSDLLLPCTTWPCIQVKPKFHSTHPEMYPLLTHTTHVHGSQLSSE